MGKFKMEPIQCLNCGVKIMVDTGHIGGDPDCPTFTPGHLLEDPAPKDQSSREPREFWWRGRVSLIQEILQLRKKVRLR